MSCGRHPEGLVAENSGLVGGGLSLAAAGGDSGSVRLRLSLAAGLAGKGGLA